MQGLYFISKLKDTFTFEFVDAEKVICNFIIYNIDYIIIPSADSSTQVLVMFLW